MKKVKVFGILLLHLLTLIDRSHNYITQPQTQVKCALDDSPCLTTQAQNTLQAFVDGIPALGIDSIDKLHVDPVLVNIPNFSYNWTDITVAGFRNAIFDHVSINMNSKVMRVLFHSDLFVELHNEAKGTVLSAYVIADGPAEIKIKNLQIEMLFTFDIVKDDNGKDIMDIKSYFYGINSLGGDHYHFGNMYNGDKKKSDVTHKLLNDSWRIVVANFGGYFHKKITDKLFEVVKIYMRSHPLEDIAIY